MSGRSAGVRSLHVHVALDTLEHGIKARQAANGAERRGVVARVAPAWPAPTLALRGLERVERRVLVISDGVGADIGQVITVGTQSRHFAHGSLHCRCDQTSACRVAGLSQRLGVTEDGVEWSFVKIQ